ncbi:START domain-containing protein 10-like isoform X3 [Apostichopus japonicus]|uniref:START domain-containing protein 10-like isoform X3 n=1 Tax=Stichopus japonicus TaxID=307972 RepID=UPI003AB663E0
MEVGEVRVADDRDFRRFLDLAEDTEGWQSKYSKNGTKVWVQLPKAGTGNEKSRMLKTVKFMEDVSAATCYDVIHDPHFRQEWDTTMLEGKEVYMLNPNNDISYYAVKCPSPLKNRDFIMQRTWLVTPTEYVIFNHSIYHSEFPPRKGLIRGESMLTGYLMRPKGKTSCELTYVTQMDPKGTVPMWAVNKVAEYLAPSILKNLHKACQRYPAWKSVNNPHYKPWLYPEQMNLPRLNLSHILSKSFSSEESLEDGDLKEEDFKGGLNLYQLITVQPLPFPKHLKRPNRMATLGNPKNKLLFLLLYAKLSQKPLSCSLLHHQLLQHRQLKPLHLVNNILNTINARISRSQNANPSPIMVAHQQSIAKTKDIRCTDNSSSKTHLRHLEGLNRCRMATLRPRIAVQWDM